MPLYSTYQAAFEDATLTLEVIEHSLEIIEVQADASITPVDHDTIVSETFSDADGYNNYVDTGNTEATFDTNKYKRPNAITEAQTANPNTADSGYTVQQGMKVQANSNFEISKITKMSNCTATKGYIMNSSVVAIATGDFVGNDCTFSSPVAITSGQVYYLVADKDGASYDTATDSASLPENLTLMDWDEGGEVQAGPTWNGGTSSAKIIKSFSTTDNPDLFIEIDLPTITGTVVNTQLIVNDPEREAGDSVVYDLIDSDSTIETGYALDTKNGIGTCDGSKISGGKIRIHLVAKGSTPTDGTPSVKTFALKLWKA